MYNLMRTHDDNTNPLRLRWENQTKHRYYEVWLARDFFDWVLTRVWGRIGAPHGQVVHKPCQHFQEGLTLIQSLAKQRKRRGYALVSTNLDEQP